NGVDLLTGTVIDRSPQRDLALIQLATIPAAAPAVTLATECPDPGERVFTIGAWPQGDENFWDLTSGSVRQVSRQTLTNGGFAGGVETDMPYNHRNSGGAGGHGPGGAGPGGGGPRGGPAGRGGGAVGRDRR